jgi:hypothetical protein
MRVTEPSMKTPNIYDDTPSAALDRITQLKSILRNDVGMADVAKRTLDLAAREETAKARLFHKI